MALLNKLFSVKEAAKELGISDGSVRRLCIDNEIGVKQGRDRFLTRRDISSLRRLREERPVGRPRKLLNA